MPSKTPAKAKKSAASKDGGASPKKPGRKPKGAAAESPPRAADSDEPDTDHEVADDLDDDDDDDFDSPSPKAAAAKKPGARGAAPGAPGAAAPGAAKPKTAYGGGSGDVDPPTVVPARRLTPEAKARVNAMVAQGVPLGEALRQAATWETFIAPVKEEPAKLVQGRGEPGAPKAKAPFEDDEEHDHPVKDLDEDDPIVADVEE